MLLLTAFEPFDGTGLNSSLEALQAWHARNPDAPVRVAVLPVRYDDDWATQQAALKSFGDQAPQSILHFGQTSGAVVDVERFALNCKWSAARLQAHWSDHTKEVGDLHHEPILAGAPPAYLSTFAVEDAVRALQSAGIPVRDSPHAGTFLCNHIFYRSLHHAATIGPMIPIAFIHLPRLPIQANSGESIPSLPLETLVQAVDTVVRIALENGAKMALDTPARFG